MGGLRTDRLFKIPVRKVEGEIESRFAGVAVDDGEKSGFERGEKLGLERGEKLGLERGEKLGLEHGEKLGQERVNRLYALLLSDSRIDDVKRAAVDSEYLEKLFKEYQL